MLRDEHLGEEGAGEWAEMRRQAAHLGRQQGMQIT
jgi:hypothetical protein